MDNRILGLIATILIILALFYPYIDFKQIGSNALVWVRNIGRLLLNPKILLTFGIAWMITNGWSYIFVIVGARYKIDWMLWLGGSYQAFLWFPLTAEKVITVAIAIILAKILFPKDKKLQARLSELNPKKIIEKRG